MSAGCVCVRIQKYISLFLVIFTSLCGLPTNHAKSVPLYARQTGQQCAACHNGFPELTPYGRLFKLNGYTFRVGDAGLPPIAAMTIFSFTHTEAPQAGGAAPHYAANDNPAFEVFSLFYGGAITDNIGMFGQVTYDNVAGRLGWDNTDIRWAKAFDLDGTELLTGVSLNNNPTLSDVWNTTPAFRFPWQSSSFGPAPAAATLIEGALAQEVIGSSTYAYWDRLLYGEVGLYRTLSNRTLTTLGVDPTGSSSTKGVAPYWRFAVEPKWGPNSFEVGTFGLAASVIPGRVTGFGTDHTVDIGFDSQYQYLAEDNTVSLQGSYIIENDSLGSSSAQGITSNGRDHIRSLNLKSSYWYQQTYGATVGYFRVDGTSDANLWGPSPSITNSPNSAGWVGEADYMPFNYGGPSFWPWLNLKLALQYVHYDKFNGSSTNYDGAGTNAHANDTLYAFVWLAY
jgi:hypothetical protein